jgi:hypothetical protein
MKKTDKQITIEDNSAEFLLYSSPNKDVKVEVFLRNQTIWLNQKQMAKLFGVNVPAISKHLKNIFDEGKLQRKATVSILETVRKEGKKEVSRNMEFYNLDAVLSVGYRVNSREATMFRIWATKTLKEYTIQGFAMENRYATSYFAYSLRSAKILILGILKVFLRLKFSRALTINKIFCCITVFI